MYRFDELIYRGTSFTLRALEDLNNAVLNELETSGSTVAVKNLQMVQLQKAVLAIGMFSLFDAILQDGLACRNGLEGAKKVLLKRKNGTL